MVTHEQEVSVAMPRHTAAAGQGGDIQLEGVEATARGEAPAATSVRDVPGGWTIPLSYIKLGRPTSADEEIAKVRLIVPHSEGHAWAQNQVCAFYYEITYERGL